MREHTALIEQIALYLGRPWKFNALEQESCWQRQIIDGQGRGLIISKEYNQPKFKISGRFDKARTRFLENEQQAELLNAMAHLFIKASGGRKISHQWSDAEKAVYFEYGTATIYGHSQEVNMDLRRLSIDQAIQIAALLNAETTKTNSQKHNLNQKEEESPND